MRLSGYFAALAATAVWAGNFVAARALAEQLPPIQFNFWRWLIAFLVILPFGWSHLRADLQIAARNFRYLSLMAILGITLMNTFIYQAGHSTESLNMALIMPATPVVVILLGHFIYKDKLGAGQLLGMFTATTGILVLISRGDLERFAGLHFQPGDIWTLGCMLCFALYSLFMRQRPHAISSVGFNIIVFGLGLIYTLPLVFGEMAYAGLPFLNWPVIAGIAYSGIGCSAIAFWLWTVAIDRIGTARSSMVYYLLPFFAALMAKMILDEKIAPAQIWGGALIIGGIMIATLSGPKARL